MKTDSSALRCLWLALIALVGVVVAVLASATFWIVGAGIAATLSAGGVTFVSVISLGLMMRQFVTATSS